MVGAEQDYDRVQEVKRFDESKLGVKGLVDSGLSTKLGVKGRTFGFFQITNHGVPTAVIDRTIGAVRAFHEKPHEYKSRFYRREMGTDVSYLSNVDPFTSKAASSSDTL